jgi:3-hydroxyisobutyrate dehydrogenase-like beta-hydroxyacid dehydrogenase
MTQTIGIVGLGIMGGPMAANLREFTMLPDSPQAEEVVLGPGGVLENAASRGTGRSTTPCC